MSDLPQPHWTINSGRVAAYDFTKKRQKPHQAVTDDVPQETIRLQNHQKTDALNLVCARCGHDWTDDVPQTMRMQNIECVYCKYAGSVVRS
jgi:hypothetical protein